MVLCSLQQVICNVCNGLYSELLIIGYSANRLVIIVWEKISV